MRRPNETISALTGSDFRVSNRPVETTPPGGENKVEAGDFRLLPRSYGTPVVCALARNPTSLFVYWEIDWPALFARTAPRDRQVYLRIQRRDGAEISRMVIEPMAGSCDVSVPNSNSDYRVELGYFDVKNDWHSAGAADVISTPPNNLSELGAATFATVPFHLSFQRLTNLFRASTSEDGPVIKILGRVQKKALQPDESGSLTSEEEEILRAVDATLPQGWRDDARDPGSEIDLEKRLGEILGFGSSSPTNSFGESSRAR